MFLVLSICILLAACGGKGHMAPVQTDAPGITVDEPPVAIQPLAGNERFTLDLPGIIPPEPVDLAAVLEQTALDAGAEKGVSALETEVGRLTITATPSGGYPDIAHSYAFEDDGLGQPVWVEAQQNIASGSAVDEYNIRGSVYNLALTGTSYAQIGLVTNFCYDYAINLSENAPNSSYMFNQNLYLLMYYDDALAGYYARLSDLNGLASPAVGPLPTGGSGDIAFDFQIRLSPLSNTPVYNSSTPPGAVGPYTDHDCGDATLWIWTEGSSWVAGSELFATMFQTYGSDNWGWRTTAGPEMYDALSGGVALMGQVYSLNTGNSAVLDFDADFFSGPPWEDDRDWWYANGSNNHNDCTMFLNGPSLPYVDWTYNPGGSFNVSSTPCLDRLGNIYYGYDTAFAGVDPTGAARAGYPYSNPGHATNDYRRIGSTISALFDVLTNDGYLYTGFVDASRYIEAVSPDGTFVWEHHILPASGDINTGITEANARIYVAQGTPNNRLVVLDAYTGNEINSYNFNPDSQNIAFTTPAVADNGTVYMTAGTRVYAFDGAGNLLYYYGLPDICNSGSVSIAPDGALFVGCLDGRLYSLLDTGAALVPNAAFGAGGVVAGVSHHTGMPAVYDAGATYYVYSADAVNSVYMLDNTGAVLHTFTTGTVYANLAVGDDGVCYAANIAGGLFALDHVSGTNLWPGFSLGGSPVGLAIGPEIGDTDNQHNLYIALSDSRLVCINSNAARYSINCTSLENCLFTVMNPLTSLPWNASLIDLDTDTIQDVTAYLSPGDSFYIEFDVDPAFPHDQVVYPANPATGDYVDVLATGLAPQGNQALYFTPQLTINGSELVLNDYAYTRVINQMESLGHAYYDVYAREGGAGAFNMIHGPLPTTGSYADPGSLDIHTYVLRDNVDFYTTFSPLPYPDAGSNGAYNGHPELIYPAQFASGYMRLTGMGGPGLTEMGAVAGPDYTDYVIAGMAGGIPGVDNNDIPVNILESDAYCRFEVENDPLLSTYLLYDVGAATWITPAGQWRHPFAVPPNTFAIARGTTFRATDGPNNTGVVTVDPSALPNGPARLNGASAYPTGTPPHDPTWHSVTEILYAPEIYFDVLPVRIWDDPAELDPDDPSMILPVPGGWDVNLGFVIQYGANPALSAYTVEVDTDYDGTWDSAPAGRTHALTGHAYNAPGVYTDTVSISDAVQLPGSYTFALKVTDSAGDEYVYPYDAAHGGAMVILGGTPNPHPWPMFKQNPLHTGVSPFVGPQTNNLKWTFATLGMINFSTPAIAMDGTVYIGSNDGNLYAVNPDGSLKWSYPTGAVYQSAAIAVDGTVYVGSDDNNLYAINPDGTLKWSYLTTGIVRSSPAIGSDGTVYVGSFDNRLYAINPDGTLKWSYLTGAGINSSPAVGMDGMVYVGSIDNNVYAINPDGTLKWSYLTTGTVWSSPALAADGTVYVGSFNNWLYAINPDGSLKWSYNTGGSVTSSPAIGADGTVYVGSWNDNLYALNPDGSLKWSYLTGNNVHSSPAISADGTVYVGSVDHNLYAINPDGSLKWSYAAGNQLYSSPSIGPDGTLYIGCDDGNLYAFQDAPPPPPGGPWPMFHQDPLHTGASPVNGPQTSNVKWTYTMGGQTHYSSPAIAWDGTLYVGNDDGNVYAINPDGSFKWAYPTGDCVRSSPAIGSDGTVYVGSWDGNMYAINPDGTLKWSYPTGNYVNSPPTIGFDGTVYVGSLNNNLYAFNPDGTVKWTYLTGSGIQAAPAIGTDGTVYVGSNDHFLHALYPDGTFKWSYLTGGNVASSPAIAADGTVYVGSEDSNLYAIYPDGSLKWTYTSGNPVLSSPAVGVDGTVYVGSQDHNLYAIYPDGTLKWSYLTGGVVQSSPVVGADGSVYVGSYDYNIHAVNPDGSVKWTYPTSYYVDSSPAIGPDGTLYIGSGDHNLYAFQDSVGFAPPVAVLNAPPFGTIGIPVNFDATASFDPDGTIVLYELDVDGDGTYDISNATGLFTYTYSIANPYWVQLRVTDNDGIQDTLDTPHLIMIAPF